MTKSKIVAVSIGIILIVSGIIWSLMFHRAKDIFRPDFVLSVAIGIGLILSGVIIIFLKKNRITLIILSLLLIWSVLMNLFLFSYAKYCIKTILEMSPDSPTAASQP